jgi:hypothetical protein
MERYSQLDPGGENRDNDVLLLCEIVPVLMENKPHECRRALADGFTNDLKVSHRSVNSLIIDLEIVHSKTCYISLNFLD